MGGSITAPHPESSANFTESSNVEAPGHALDVQWLEDYLREALTGRVPDAAEALVGRLNWPPPPTTPERPNPARRTVRLRARSRRAARQSVRRGPHVATRRRRR